MFQVLLLCTVFGVVVSRPANEPVPIISQESVIEPDGSFHYSYETGDGVKANAVGEVKVIDKDTSAGIHHGEYSYPSDDGKTIKVTYVADENGYQPQGDHIPGIPEQIQKALAYLATAPPPKE